MRFIKLYCPEEDDLPSHGVIRRIAPAFRYVVLDRARGEAEYRKEWDKVKSLNAPEVILQTYSIANCRTVWVEVADRTNGWLRFMLWSRRGITIEFESDAEYTRLLPTVEKLAILLGYVAEVDENAEQLHVPKPTDLPVETRLGVRQQLAEEGCELTPDEVTDTLETALCKIRNAMRKLGWSEDSIPTEDVKLVELMQKLRSGIL